MKPRLFLILTASILTLDTEAATLVYRGIPTGRVAMERKTQIYPQIVVAGRNGQTFSIESEVWEELKGEIGGFDISPKEYDWIWLNGKIQCRGLATRGRLVDRTSYFEPYRKNGRIFAGRLGEVWVAGAAKMRGRDGLFVPSGFSPEDELQVQPRCDDPFGNTWAALVDGELKERGVAVRSFARPDRWLRLDLPKDFPTGWVGMCTDDVGFVWIAAPNALIQIDPRDPKGVVRIEKISSAARITSIAPLSHRQILVGYSDGQIKELIARPQEKTEFRNVLQLSAGSIRAMHENFDGMLWVVAGANVYGHRLGKREWKEGKRMPAGNHDNIFVELGGRFYSAGGKTYFGWPASQWVNLDHLWSFHPNGGWQLEPPMLEPGKAYSGIAKQNERIWIIGGYFRAEKGTRATDTVEIYDPESRRYRFGPKYPAARGQIVALNVGERIYAIGGEGNKVASPEMFSIGIGQSRWNPEPPAPGPVTQAAGCVIGEKLFITAGPRANCPGLFVYDTTAKKWSTVKHPTDPPPAAPLVTAWRDEVWVMGGRGNSSGVKAVWAYSTKTGKWRQGPDLPIPVSWGAACSYRNIIMIAGGAYRDEAVGNYFNSDQTFFHLPQATR